MENVINNKKIVENIRREIEDCRKTRIWNDFINSLKHISQAVFTRSSGFILELIQNAEDAGLRLKGSGEFTITINKNRIKVTHNGCPFSENDVNALCGIRSSKKPERGTLGYLGIGFKSVFKITDSPEVYSNGFQFKFDRTVWSDPADTPWHVIPLWIDNPSENIDINHTTFIIPFREPDLHYIQVLDELKKLKTELYLFLHWLKKIKVIDEVSNETWTIENAGENENGFTVLKHNEVEQRFKFFRCEITVPDCVKIDRLTQEYRANVSKREIAIGFALDENGNLSPSEAGAMYGGVYSFTLLGEAKSGAKFPIQADFLVQPGREAINYEAKWNHWLMEEVSNLCKEAIEHFKNHPKWKYQFLPAFEFNKNENLESYTQLFGPKLTEPIEKFLEDDNCVPTKDGGWAKPNQIVRLTEDKEASESLITMSIFKEDEIAPVMGGQLDLKLVHPDVKETKFVGNKVNRLNLLENVEHLTKQSQNSNAASWFLALYRWLHNYPIHEDYWPRYARYAHQRVVGYHKYKFILTAQNTLLTGGDVYTLDNPVSDLFLPNISILHSGILSSITDVEEQKELRGFLIRYTGLQTDGKKICQNDLLPKILTTVPKPTIEDLLKYTSYCQQILGDEIAEGCEFWILTKQGDIRPAKEVLFSGEFKPEQDWESHQQYVSGGNFISSRYIEGITDDQMEKRRRFFKKGGVKDAPDNGVEVFAMKYVEEKLKGTPEINNVILIDKRNFGYDMEAETKTGKKMYIEVKGKSSDSDVELTGNETKAADKYKDDFYLYVVSSIPNNPELHIVKDPAEVGDKDKLTITVSKWKSN